MSPRSPRGVPKTYGRHIREFFGCYYPNLSFYGNWWDQVPKTLKDTLDEYGAYIQDGKLCDATGREICILKKWTTPSGQLEWDERHLNLLPKPCTVLVVDVKEDE
jgi:hypothetical protein